MSVQYRTPKWQQLIVTAILLLVTAIVAVPFIWMISMSFRTTLEILTDPFGPPNFRNFGNYMRLLGPEIRFYRYFLNSVVVTCVGIVLTLVLSTLGGYGFARRRFAFPARNLVFTVLLFTLMLPRQAMYIPQYILMTRYGLLNTHLGLSLVYTAYAITISTYLFRSYFAQLPEELEESARIDGAGDLLIFSRIMLPLTRPVVATVVLLTFMQMWNELLMAMTMITNHAKRTLPLAMMNFVGENGADYAMAASSLVVGMLPLLILYLALSERFVSGLTAGALKG